MEENEATWMKHIPNMLSILRLMMVGVYIYFFKKGEYVGALGIYFLAMLTDILDGYLARRNNWITSLGKVLDPFADKLMLVTALTCFASVQWIPVWLVIIVGVKELIMIIGGAFLLKKEVVVFADRFGKCATGFFNAGVITTLLKRFFPWIEGLSRNLLLVAMMLGIVALVHYAKKNVFSRLKIPPEIEHAENESK